MQIEVSSMKNEEKCVETHSMLCKGYEMNEFAFAFGYERLLYS